MIDYWQLAKDYKAGDLVQRIKFTDGSLSPFVGRVTHSSPGLGVVQIQWPYGNEQVFPDELVKVNPALHTYLPPTLVQSVYADQMISDRTASPLRKATIALWRHMELPPGIFKDLAIRWAKNQNEVLAYDDLYRGNPGVNEVVLRGEVQKFYQVSQRMADLRIDQYAVKTAAYWMAQNRTYRATQDELTAKKPLCPKCGTKMRRATYKMHEGAKHRLFACPKDLFLIKQEHILGPEGTPVEW